jgi:hypothetical protein
MVLEMVAIQLSILDDIGAGQLIAIDEQKSFH